MRKSLALAGAALLAAMSTVAHADDAAFAPKLGQMVYSSDGSRIGRIDRIDGQRVGIIFDMTYVYVPVDSLAAGDKGRAVTKLTYKEVTKR
jgi:hypothetical protein